jgi:hypothetical protein
VQKINTLQVVNTLWKAVNKQKNKSVWEDNPPLRGRLVGKTRLSLGSPPPGVTLGFPSKDLSEV